MNLLSKKLCSLFILSLGIILIPLIFSHLVTALNSFADNRHFTNTAEISDATGSISGFVFQSDNLTPIEGATLTASYFTWPPDSSFKYSDTSVSNSDGSYTISGLPPGDYRIKASAKDYIFEYFDGNYGEHFMVYAKPISDGTDTAPSYSSPMPENIDRVRVNASQNTQLVNFSLDRGGSISGYVFQDDGITPIEGAELFAQFNKPYWYGKGTRSNADGSYTISGLPTGLYMLSADADNFAFSINRNSPEYFISDRASVKAPADTPNINFNLERGGTISGFVFKDFGETPMEGSEVTITLKNTTYFEKTASGADGSYIFKDLPSGEYFVRAQSTDYKSEGDYYNKQNDMHRAIPVTVISEEPISDINLYPNRKIYIQNIIIDAVCVLISLLIIFIMLRRFKNPPWNKFLHSEN